MTFTKHALAVATLALSSLAMSCGAWAATDAKPMAKLSDAEINSIVDQLAKSGKLDPLIQNGIQKFIEAEQAKAPNPNKARKVDATREHLLGNPKAEWTWIVYSDLECPFCKSHAGVPESVAQKIGYDKINVVFRHFPLPMHGDAARKEAVAAECVAKQSGSEGFFKFANSVLNASQLNGKGLPNGDAQLVQLAKDAGAKNEKQFDSCLQDSKSAEPVRSDIEDGMQAGVNGTPGNILRNNKTGKSIAFHGADRSGGSATFEALVRKNMAQPADASATK